jgi:hypothetical protein
MVPAFAIAITIATNGDNDKFRINYPGSSCRWQRSTVKDI